MSEVCSDNRFELIGEFKDKIVKGTNIEMSPQEMAVLDNILFRFWQMGWLDKLKAQEPRVMTVDDFIDNPDADSEGFLPVWVEYRRDGEWADYWDDEQDEWSTADGISNDGYRVWTARPTEEQMKATPWT